MDGIHPKFVLSKRFPVHAAIEQLDLVALRNLLTPASDARFHFGRKLTNTDVSVLHQACAARPHPQAAVLDIVKLCTALGAPVNDCDCIGQTPLFYATTNCLGAELVPVLLKAGANVNAQRSSDGWTALHVAAMAGRLEVATLLLQAGADPGLEDHQEVTASQLARRYGHRAVADCILSPRDKYRPEFPVLYMDFLKTSAQPDSVTILYDEHLEWRDPGGASLLHVACWTGNIELFRAFCLDTNGRKLLTLPTTAGLTPLMFAIINGQTGIVEEYFTNRNSKKDIYFHKVVRDTKQTVLFLLFLHCPGCRPSIVLKRKDLGREVVNAVDSKGNTALMACCLADCRDTVRRLLSSKAATERHLFDLAVKNIYNKTALHILVMNNDKYNVRLLLNLLEDAGDCINATDCSDMTPVMYALNRGNYEVYDTIINHPKVKGQINWELKDPKARTITQMAEEAKKKRLELAVINLPVVKPEPEAGPKRNFQQEMNDIYKSSQGGKEKKENAPNPANVMKKPEPPRPNPEAVTPKGDVVSKPKEDKTSNGVHINGNFTNGKEEPDSGPSVEDIRSQWKKNKSAEERRALIDAELDTNSLLEDLAKKAELKANESKSGSSDYEYITESMNEEINWALQMKKEQAETKSLAEKEKVDETKGLIGDGKPVKLSQSERMKLLKEKEAEEQKQANAQPSEQEKMANLYNAMAKKSDERKVVKDKQLEPERMLREQQSIEDAMSEEIQWALEQKRHAAEEQKINGKIKESDKLQEEEDQRIMDGIKEKKKIKEKKAAEEADRLKRIEEEKDGLAKLQREAEEKIRKRKEAKVLKEKQQMEEDDSLAKLPRWKREKVLKEREAQAAKDAESELQQRVDEELEWAETVKNQHADLIIEEPSVNVNKEEDKNLNDKLDRDNREREDQMKIEEEKRIKEAKEVKERDKNPTVADLERRRKEDLEIQAAMAEEVQWALDQKKQQAEEMRAKDVKLQEEQRSKEHRDEEDRKIMNSILEKKKAKEEMEAKDLAEKERKKSADNEKKNLAELEKKALDMIEVAKKDAEKQKQEKIKKEKEKQRVEEEERKRNLEEELRWAEEARLQEELERKEKARREKEKIETERRAKEEADREMQRQIMLRQEKDMLEKLENAATEKLKLQKEEEELRAKKEQEAWVKMPKWKKEKVLRERRSSSTTNSTDNSRKNSLAVAVNSSPETESPKTESPKSDRSDTDTLAKEVEEEVSKIDVSAIWNESIEASSTGVPADGTIAAVLGLAESSQAVGEEVTTDKFSAWLRQELQQAGEPPVPPAPARRRRRGTGEEEAEEAVPAVRPCRRSRAEEPSGDGAAFLAPEQSPKSPVPQAARRTRRSPLPPSPAPTTTRADIAELVEQSAELEDPETRAELMMIIQAFILEKRGKL